MFIKVDRHWVCYLGKLDGKDFLVLEVHEEAVHQQLVVDVPRSYSKREVMMVGYRTKLYNITSSGELLFLIEPRYKFFIDNFPLKI